MLELVMALMTWIAGETAFPMPPPPHVVMAPKERMSLLAYQRDWHPTDDVRGLYHHGTRTVYLPETWDGADLRSRATLLHELVHHMQVSSGHPQDDCEGRREEQAYALTLKWLREQGAPDPYAALGLDQFSIKVYSICGSD